MPLSGKRTTVSTARSSQLTDQIGRHYTGLEIETCLISQVELSREDRKPMTELRANDAAPRPLVVAGLTLDFGPLRAVDDVSFELDRGDILCLLGASGSGKSSVLRLIAGLERPTRGEILIDGRSVAGRDAFVEPERRQVGMVFQDFALFPHLTVRGNVAFGLRGRPAAEIARTVTTLLTDVELVDRADSYPHMLSGGERQRVALARALAPGPADPPDGRTVLEPRRAAARSGARADPRPPPAPGHDDDPRDPRSGRGAAGRRPHRRADPRPPRAVRDRGRPLSPSLLSPDGVQLRRRQHHGGHGRRRRAADAARGLSRAAGRGHRAGHRLHPAAACRALPRRRRGRRRARDRHRRDVRRRHHRSTPARRRPSTDRARLGPDERSPWATIHACSSTRHICSCFRSGTHRRLPSRNSGVTLHASPFGALTSSAARPLLSPRHRTAAGAPARRHGRRKSTCTRRASPVSSSRCSTPSRHPPASRSTPSSSRTGWPSASPPRATSRRRTS